MNNHFSLKTSIIVGALLAFSTAQAATLSKVEYKADKDGISAIYTEDKAVCASFYDNTKDICGQEANGRKKIALAELEYRFTGKAADLIKVLNAQAESAYAVAKEKCDDLAGNTRDLCVKEAKAIEVTALADAKLGKKTLEAKKVATDDKVDANYQVALEKCDILAGDGKTSCAAAAKTRFGKT